MAAANEGLLSCEWEVVPYTRQPLMRGYYHVNERLSRSHGSHWWGAIIMWMRGCSVHTAAANEGLLSCEWEVVPFTRQPLMRGWYPVNEWGAKWLCSAHSRTPLWGGGCMLTQWVFPCGICGDVRSLCSRICPRLSAPPWKGGVRSRADVLSCRFEGERNADI